MANNMYKRNDTPKKIIISIIAENIIKPILVGSKNIIRIINQKNNKAAIAFRDIFIIPSLSLIIYLTYFFHYL